MKTKRNAILKSLVASAAFAVSLPVFAEVDAWFLREMARSDGNPQGDGAIPTVSDYTLSKKAKAEQDAFIIELARTDGTPYETAQAPTAEAALAAR